MRTRGFNTRKMQRLSDNKRALLIHIERIEKSIRRLVRTKDRWKRNLAKIEADMERLEPRLKGEEVRVLYFSELESFTKELSEIF